MSTFRQLMMANALPPDDIIFEIQTTAESLTYQLRVESTMNRMNIDWGDGTQTIGGNHTLAHTYPAAGKYRITIKDASQLTKIRLAEPAATYGAMVTKILRFRAQNLTSLQLAFRLLSNITSLPADFKSPDTVTNIGYMCDGCTNLVSVGGFSIPSGLTEAYRAFSGCSNLASLPKFPSSFTADSINFQATFDSCLRMTGTAPAALLWEDTSKTWSSFRAFFQCTSLTNYSEIPSGWK